jgi:predicted O-methyltransferase YrrM
VTRVFNPLEYPILFDEPERLTIIPTWHEHIPFAMFLIQILQPKLLVELGTLYGDSYCAFCQAIKKLKLETRTFAVDTWQGDEHTSYQFTEALPDLRAHHDPRYGAFSTLLQSTFDEALPRFQDSSIDLLHIDGLHTYEAVKHDFETWLPKVSERGVVIFHDSNVLERGFGVRQFWDEIRQGYPHFEFLHGYGLGVLAVGRVDAPELQAMFKANAEEMAALRNLFYCLGYRLRLKLQVQLYEENVAGVNAAAAQSQQTALAAQQQLQAAESEVTSLRNQLDQIVGGRAWKIMQALWWMRRRFRS